MINNYPYGVNDSTGALSGSTGVIIYGSDGRVKFIGTGGGGGVASVTAVSPITSTGGANPVISTLMNTNKLIGRSTAGTGVMEEITIGSGLSLSAGTISATGTTASDSLSPLLLMGG